MTFQEPAHDPPSPRFVGQTVGNRAYGMPLIGRHEELELLLRRLGQTREGAGRVVLLTGEPGIGKSRLLRALVEALDEDVLVMRFFCSPHHRDRELHPIIGNFEHAARISKSDTDGMKFSKLKKLLAAADASDETISLFAEMLAIPAGRYYQPLEISPQKRRQRLFEALQNVVVQLAKRQPVLHVVEDLQWSDPTSLELIAQSVDLCASMRLMLLLSARPEFKAPWPDEAHVTTLMLNRMSHSEGAALAQQVLDGNRSLSDARLKQVLERAEGVPLFIEELTKSVFDTGMSDRQDSSSASRSTAIPASLQELLFERLERLGPAREIAQIGAAIGRRFTHTLLLRIAGQRQAAVEPALAQLVRAGFLLRTGNPPEARYTFKHALVQQVAYESLAPSLRIIVHPRIAEALQERDPTISETEPDLLAWHYEQGGLIEQAATHYIRAAWRSALLNAHTEAREQCANALRLIARLPEGELRDRMELEVLAHITGANRVHQEIPGFDPLEVHARAAALWTRLGRPADFIGIAHDRLVYHLLRSDTVRAKELAGDLLRSGQDRNDPRFAIAGHLLVGCAAMLRGELADAHTHLHASLSTIQSGPDDPSVLWRSQKDALHPWVMWANANCWLGNVKCWLGFPDQALEYLSRFLDRVPSLGYGSALANGAIFKLRISSFVSEVTELGPLVRALSKVADPLGMAFFDAQATIFKGYIAAASGEAGKGLDLMHDGIAAYAETEAVVWSGYHLALLADVYHRLGRLNEARLHLVRAQDLARRTGERWYDAELERRLGDIDRTDGDLASAEDRFYQAMAIAQHQHAKLWELHAAVSLARLLRHRNKGREARAILAPVYDWFTEGFGTASLRRARPLLEELDFSGVPYVALHPSGSSRR